MTDSTIHDVACAVIVRNTSVMAARRGPDVSNPGAWELPGGKPMKGEKPADCVVRRVKDELGINIKVVETLESYDMQVNDTKTFRMHPFIAVISDGRVMLKKTHSFAGWFTPLELVRLGWPSSDIPVIDIVVSRALKMGRIIV